MSFSEEFARIARHFRPLSEGLPGAFALGDDAAALAVPAGQELVVTTDAMVENIHFLPEDMPQSVAARLLRANLSDLAAMGATPMAYLLVTALSEKVGEEWLAAFASALAEDQKNFSITLAGGDSVRTGGPITLAVTALGLAPAGQVLRRKTKRPVNGKNTPALYVSGTIGDSALGLMLGKGEKFASLQPDEENGLKERHFSPTPRLELGRTLRPFAQAVTDVSDGLVADIGHIAEQSEAEATLHAADIPFSPAARKVLDERPDLFEALITGGEDYELAFAMGIGEEHLLKLAARQINLPLTKIGRLAPGVAGEIHVLDRENHVIPLKQKGWTHF